MSVFQNVATRPPGSSVFNLSHEKKLTASFGKLYPAYLQEIIPGDRFQVNSEILLRMAPTLAPIMHRVNVSMHYFFVPNRLVWRDWQEFITGGELGESTLDQIPYQRYSETYKQAYKVGGLADYLGVPTMDQTATHVGNQAINLMPFRAYQLIYNEYFRDENLQTKVEIGNGVTHGDQAAFDACNTIRYRNYERDYLTSCLPWAQKGNPIQAPIDLTYLEPAVAYNGAGVAITNENLETASEGQIRGEASQQYATIDNIDSEATGIDVNELRKAVRLQEWLEKNARAGSRYVESIMAHFDERVPDYTAQRPVFLGGGKQPVTISEVLSTYSGQQASTHDLPQGNMAGHGISVGKTNRFRSKFTEHGYVMGILSVLPRTAYQQGFDRHWLYKDKFDIYWPEFAQLGEQQVLNGEAYVDETTTDEDFQGAFGYQGRYNHMKYRKSEVSGNFRDSLAFWHMGRIFSNTPALNAAFVEASDVRKDIFAVTEEGVDNLYVQIYHDVKAVRKMPYHNVPTL